MDNVGIHIQIKPVKCPAFFRPNCPADIFLPVLHEEVYGGAEPESISSIKVLFLLIYLNCVHAGMFIFDLLKCRNNVVQNSSLSKILNEGLPGVQEHNDHCAFSSCVCAFFYSLVAGTS